MKSDPIVALLPPTTIVAMLTALYMAFVGVPSDASPGPEQRIFYVHLATSSAPLTYFALL